MRNAVSDFRNWNKAAGSAENDRKRWD